MPTTVLTNLERRVAGNLSIPRPLRDLAHMLATDPKVKTPTDPELAAKLEELEGLGIVVNLGQHEDLAKLAAGLEKHKTALAMPDDKAANYVARVGHPDRSWRRYGDLWLLTEEGLAQLVAPDPLHEEYTTTLAELHERISAEARRVHHDAVFEGSIFDEEREPGDGLGGGRLLSGHQLANGLLVEEYKHWEALVIAEHEAQTGERVRPLIAGGSGGYGDATELLVLAADTGGTAYGETSPTFIAITSVAVTDADTGSSITRVSYTGYADKSTANTDFSSPSAGAHTTTNALTYAPCTGGSGTGIGFARVTTSGGGRLIRYGSMTSTVISTTNTPASFAAGAYTDTLD